ncbi:hypothetical protein MKW92_038380 [Papaver armeniacum]|nr:hypothetical protein MKW92_038380 [Papaver armeniacum]
MRFLQGSWLSRILMFLSFSIFDNSCAQGQCLNDQRALLLQLNQSLISSEFSIRSSFLSKRSSWHLNTDCCSSWQGVKCDRAGHVISLDLSGEHIVGGLNDSSSLFNFQYIKRLNLAGNPFGSYMGTPIPSGLGRLVSLNYLNLSFSGFAGQVPIDISYMTKLVTLDLSDLFGPSNLILRDPDFKTLTRNLSGLENSLISCGLYGKFPARILQLQTLRSLDLSFNDDLQGSIPEFPTDGQLQELVLHSTGFAGGLPDSIGNLRLLSKLDLNNCYFNGSIPTSVSNLNRLQYLDLAENYFTGQLGSLPTSVSMLNHLQYYDLSGNSFNGHIGEFSVGSSSPLRKLDLSNNQLQGRVPLSIFEFSRLTYLSLGSNNFSDSNILDVPFHKLRNLNVLDLSNIRLSINTTTASFASYPQLRSLILSSCKLTEFPIFMNNQSQLHYLDLSNNHIHGNIPNWIWKIGNGLLNEVNLSHNLLEDPYEPVRVFESFALVLDLNSNKLQGKNPILGSSIHALDYSFNNLTSIIPNISSYLSAGGATFFSLSNNQIKGEIPTYICEVDELKSLDMSHNNLSGPIPACLGSMEHLKMLNLRGNNLQGVIPDTFPNSSALEKLDLNGNQLQGQLPRSLASCTELIVLDVGNNQLSGTIPSWFGSLAELRVLVLRSNKFHGRWGTKASDCNFPKLQIIDVSFNNFSGNLPKICFSNWRGMMENKEIVKETSDDDQVLGFGFEFNDVNYQVVVTVTIKGLVMEVGKILDTFTTIDFSSNRFEEGIPESIGDLTLLYTLNLSRNALTGTIPSTIGNLTHLESLDFSRNKLNGNIPVQLAGLSYLAVLDLSFNKLVGRIPPGTQFQTFNSTVFEGNDGLCGFPLAKNCTSITESPTNVSGSKNGFDWILFAVTFLGFVVGASMVIGPQYFWKKGREWANERINKVLNIT